MNEANHIDVRTRLLGISFNICMITARTEILDLLDMGGWGGGIHYVLYGQQNMYIK